MSSSTMKRYTLSLPANVHNELTSIANEKGSSVREIMLKSLKIGLLAINLDEDKELIVKENTVDGVIETKLLVI